MGEGARLESVYMAKDRGFESLSLCKEIMLPERGAFFVLEFVKLFSLTELYNKKGSGLESQALFLCETPLCGINGVNPFKAHQAF